MKSILKWFNRLRSSVKEFYALELAVNADGAADDAISSGDIAEYSKQKELAAVRWAAWHSLRELNPMGHATANKGQG